MNDFVHSIMNIKVDELDISTLYTYLSLHALAYIYKHSYTGLMTNLLRQTKSEVSLNIAYFTYI